MIFNPLQIEFIASGLSLFSAILTSVLLIINNRDDRVARAFLFALLLLGMWAGFKLLSYTVSDIELVRILRTISISFIPLLGIGVARFAIIFYEEARKTRYSVYSTHKKFIYPAGIILFLFLISDLFFKTNLIIGGIKIHPTLKFSPIPGIFSILLIVYFFTMALYTGFVVYKSKKESNAVERNRANWIIGSMVFGLVAGGGGFGSWFNIPGSSLLSIFAAPIFTIGIFYSITKHNLFNIKTTAVELIVFSIWAFLFFRILFSGTLQEKIADGVLLFIIIILGIILIKSVFKEVKQKEELEKIATKLKNLNKTLGQKVKERTEEISRSKKHTEAIIENLTIGLVEHDDMFKISRINTAAENILNINRNNTINKVITKNPKDSKYSALAKILYLNKSENIKEKITHGNTKLHEVVLEYPSKKILQVTTVPFTGNNPSGSTKKYIKLIRDITQEKEVDEAKSSFISIAAHQLRTPLSAIKWVFALALSGNLGKITKTQKEMFEKGSKSNENMIHIVNDLLDVSRIEKGSYVYDLKENNITELVNEVVEASKFTMKEKNLIFNIVTPTENIPLFLFDKERVRIVLQNILDNATTYTQSGGEINIYLSQKKGNVIIKIEDNGMGISAEDLKKVFTKFFRSKKALHVETDRSGLGLFIAKEIVTAHKGTLTIESKEDKGTVVTITLPAKK